MPPATAWGWNPQLLAAGSAYAQGYGGQAAAFTDCPGPEAANSGGNFRFPRRTGVAIFFKARAVRPLLSDQDFINRIWTKINADENPEISLFICVNPVHLRLNSAVFPAILTGGAPSPGR